MIQYAPFCEKQQKYIRRTFNSWLNVAEGGKRAGKNIINLVAWSISLETHPDKIHLAAGVSIGTAKMNILDSNGFGLRNIFAGRCRSGKYMEKEALYIQTVTGEKIVIFAGGAKSNDAAFIKGNSYGSVYVTEANECNQAFIQEVLDRTLSSSKRQVFFDLNPKPPRHWFYTQFLDFQDELKRQGKNDGYNYEHFTIADNLSLSDAQLKEVLSKYNKNSIWYKADILGLRTSAEGRIYQAYEYDEVAIGASQIKEMRFIELAIGVDVGGTDATVATLVGITQGWKEIVLIDGIYNKQGLSSKIDEAMYVQMVADWMETWVKVYPRIGTVYVDSAAKLFRVGLNNELLKRNMRKFVVQSFNKADGINERIELNEALLAQGRFKVASHLRKWHDAYQNATWSTAEYAKGAWVRLDDGSYPVDCLDSAEYGFYPFKKFVT